MWCSHKRRKDIVIEGFRLECQSSMEIGSSVPARCPLSRSYRDAPTQLVTITGFSTIVVAQSMQGKGDNRSLKQCQAGGSVFNQQSSLHLIG